MDHIPPFLSNEPMVGDPPCRWADFLSPKLRRFPHDLETLSWQRYLGHGVEGCVSTIRLGDKPDLGAFALKMFFRTGPLGRHAFDEINSDHGMWSLEDEALVVAVLEKASAGLRASRSPIHVPAQRKSRLDALASLYACSLEGRQACPYDQLPPDQRVSLSALFESTRLRKCFGWISLKGKDLGHLNDETGLLPAYDLGKTELIPIPFESHKTYFGIVYEYIPPAVLEAPAMQRQIDFLYYVGLNCDQACNQQNWQGPGIRLDFGDFSTPICPRFRGQNHRESPTDAEYILGIEETKEDPDYDTLKDEIEEIQRRDRVPLARALAVERAYCARYFAGDKRQRHPNQVSTRLPEEVLTAVRVPEIEPMPVRRAWQAYRQLKLKYLAAFEEAESMAEEEGVKDTAGDDESHQ